ncbi:MAG: circadian clock protein KaiB [Candidatus Saccharibacteria bacterium]|nr:circadian clock protein KaiB [Pseudorhodobacter sp.]
MPRTHEPEDGWGAIIVRFRLYVAGNMPNSRRAVANLRKFCIDHIAGRYTLEIIDVYEVPERALEDKVMLTPLLSVETPHGIKRIAGDLSDRASLAAAIDAGSLG